MLSMEELVRIDRLTPLYRFRLERMKPRKRKIVWCLALLGPDSATAKELSVESRIDVHKLCVYLKRLSIEGIVKIDKQARPMKYEIADADLGLYIRARAGRT